MSSTQFCDPASQLGTSVVVTGGAGFLGRAVARRMSTAGYEVTSLSRRAQDGMVQVDAYADAPSGDVLIHLAECSDRSVAEQGGESYANAAVDTVAALLAKPYRRVVYVSSAVLYSDRYSSKRKTDDPVHVFDVYSSIKRRCEVLTLASNKGVVVRPANIYGPGMSPANVVSAVLRQVPGSGKVVLRDGRPVRDFVWISDAAEGVARAAMGTQRGIFNIGSGVATSIFELASTALGICNEAHRSIESASSGSGESTLVLDIDSTTEAFGYRPAMSLRDGLTHLITPRQ